jgi:hypothetical protein
MTSKPAGKLLFQVTGAFAEFERSMIRQRVNAGLARARAQGRRLGRPPLAADKEASVRALLASGTGIAKAARCAPALCSGKPNDLAAGTASHQLNFLAARLNGTQNFPNDRQPGECRGKVIASVPSACSGKAGQRCIIQEHWLSLFWVSRL